LGIGDWAQSPIPNPQSPIPNPQLDNYQINIYIFFNLKKINLKKLLFYLKDNEKKPIK
jgi:hypothetical protein